MKTKFFILIFLSLYIYSHSQKWDSLKGGMDGVPWVFFEDTVADILYVGGGFEYIEGMNVNSIATWDGSKWDSVGFGIGGTSCNFCNIYAITRYNGKIYVGGDFIIAGNIPAKKIATWDGVKWDSVGSGTDGAIWDMLVHNNELYVCGSFSKAGGILANRIAKWNGVQWSAIDDTTWDNMSTIRNIIFYNNELYVTGNFSNTSTGIKGIAKWNGTFWEKVGNMNSFAADMEIYNSELYVIIGTELIYKWNGVNWSGVGGGIPGATGFADLFSHNNKLYVASQFTTAGGIPAQNIAIWDGAQWCGLGSSFDDFAASGGFFRDTLYIGGGFRTIDGDSVNGIAKWIGGSYTDTCGNASGVSENDFLNEINIYPNPSNGNFRLAINDLSFFNAEVNIFNSLGEKVHAEIINQKTLIINLDSPNGIYLVRIQTGKGIVSKKLIVAR